MNKPHFLYILHAPQHDKFYVGETANIHLRLQQHNHSEESSFTAKYRPWKLVALFRAPNKGVARKCERFIKKQKSKVFIQKIITAGRLSGGLAQLVRVPNLRD